jgi:outer membrane protein TolC
VAFFPPRRAPGEPRKPLLRRAPTITTVLLGFSSLLSGCVLEPDGFEEEQARARDSGRAFEPAFEERELPELDQPVTWQSLLARALAANGDLEAAWFEWSAALERVRIAGGRPDTNLAPSFGYLVSEDRMKTWDRVTIDVAFDPMKNLSWPTKVTQAARVALDEAIAAGRRFEARKFEVQRGVLDAWLELSLHEEQIRLQREQVELDRAASESAARTVRTGGPQRELLRARVELELAQNQLATMDAEHHAMKAALNGLVARAPEAPLELAAELPPPRPIPVDDPALLAAGVARNPELAALAADVKGREDAVELARRQFIPDLNPFLSLTGGVTELIGVGVTLPTTIPQLKAAVAEARQRMREVGAMARQARFERASRFVAALALLRNAQRQTALLRDVVLPVAARTHSNVRETYAAGRATLLELLDAQRVLLEVRRAIAEAQIEREMRLAELEQLGGFDVEALAIPEDSDVPAQK